MELKSGGVLDLPNDILKRLQELRRNSTALRQLPTELKNKALDTIAHEILASTETLLTANRHDLAQLPPDTSSAFRDRMTLNKAALAGMAESLRQVAALPDPVNEIIERKTLANGLQAQRVRAPLGLIFMIFESRPNVIIEAFSLAFKSGNAIVFRGGSESAASNGAMYKLISGAMKQAGISLSPFYGLEDYDRKLVETLLHRKDLIDVTVPRGGDALIAFVQKTAEMPIIKNDRGLCHTYVDDDAQLDMALRIVANAKIQRPGVCNSLETVLVHEAIAKTFIPQLYQSTSAQRLQWHADATTLEILKGCQHVTRAEEKDWDTEYLDLIINCRVVKDLDEALAHIAQHGSKHSEAIVTQKESKARRFQNEVDAAAVYWNASTRFTDGFELGLGGELGISTQKLHVRGPVGLRELTTPRWVIDGTGQIRT
jgi:glutamate-5-semialdehyde dehydrogenase